MEHLLKLALAYYKKSNYQQSLKYLDRLLNNPRNDVYSFDAEFWSLKEECHQALGEFNESDYCIDMGIEIDPSFYAEKATLCRSKGEYEKALQYIDKLINIYPDSDGLWWEKGDSLEKIGNKKDALECYDMSIHLNPTNILYWISKGSILIDIGSFKGSIICFDRALEIDPANSITYNLKGNALYSLGQYKDAIDSYDLALNIDPTNEVIKNNKNSAQNTLKAETESSSNLMANYKCVKCGFDNLEGASFCSGCGIKLNVGNNLICNDCGSTNKENSFFCQKCGKKL